MSELTLERAANPPNIKPNFPYCQLPMGAQTEMPEKNLCLSCGTMRDDLQRCQRCKRAPYCSRECQKADWPEHKKICVQYAAQSVLNDTGTTEGEKGPKRRGGQCLRTRADIMTDLTSLAVEHSCDTFTVASWFALGLLYNLERRKTHFLAITLSRNHDVSRSWPRRLYKLIDADVLPFDVLNKRYDSYTILGPDDQWPKEPQEGLSPSHPRMALQSDEEITTRQGHLGSIMVVSVELNEKEKHRTVKEAVEKTAVPIFAPLALTRRHQRELPMVPPSMRARWRECLKHALDGGRWSLRYQPYNPPE